MSIQAMTWAFGIQNLKPLDKLVLVSLADQANDEGLCHPSIDTLARMASTSVRSVKRSVAFLKGNGFLEVVHRSSQDGRLPNGYRLFVGLEISLGINQRANLALSETEPVDNLDENGTFRCEQTKGPDWHLADSESSQSANVGALPPLNNPNLNSIPTTEPYVMCDQGGLVGVDGLENSSSEGAGEVAPDWGLIRACLPSVMMGVLPDSAAQVVSGLLHEALGAGWSEREILKRLAANAFPSEVRNGAGLVIYRLRDVLAAPVPGSVAPVVAQKQRKRDEWGRAEVAAILEGRSKLDLTAQENVLSTFLCGHFGCMPDQSEASVITAKLGEITEALYAKADAERAKRRVREVRVGVP